MQNFAKQEITVPISPLGVSLVPVYGQSDAFKPFSSSYILYDEEKGIHIMYSFSPYRRSKHRKGSKELHILAQNTIIVS